MADNRPDQNTDADNDPNNPAKKLSAAEQAAADQRDAFDNDIQKLEGFANDQQAHRTYVDNWSKRRSRKSEKLSVLAMKLLKKAGPSGLVGGGTIAIVIALMSSLGPLSLLTNLKENAVFNHDQQSFSSEVRTRKILAKRLGEQTTSRCSALSALLCRYEKPSNRLLTRMETEKIKAFDKNGDLISKQKILNGTRPAAYSFNDGDLIEAKDFEKTMRDNGEFARAFRRAYSPRWALFADDLAIRLLRGLKISKTAPDSLKNADATDPPDKKLASALPDTDGDTASRTISQQADDELKKSVKNFAEGAGGRFTNDALLNTAVAGCVASKVPGVYVDASRAFKLSLIAAAAFAPFVVADTQKASAADAKTISNTASLLTDTYTKSDGTTVKSAMSSGLMYYLLSGNPQDGASDKNHSMFNLGIKNSTLGSYVNFVSGNKEYDTFCNVAASNGAQLAADVVDVAKLSNPVGWAAVVADVVLIVLDETGVLDDIIEGIIKSAAEVIGPLVPWEKIAKTFLGNIDTGVVGEPYGAMVAIGAVSIFALLANKSGGLPLTTKQSIKYTNEVTKPTQLAWIKEDQATHSPFDTSNPHTALGSITSALLPYTGSFSSVGSALSSIVNISALSFGNTLFTKNTYASADLQGKNWCTEDSVIASYTNISVGPACDIQYGIPTEYLDTDPTVVVEALTESGDIDEDGNVVEDSELEGFITRCNSGSVAGLSECAIEDSATASLTSFSTASDGLGAVTLANATLANANTKKAFFALYQMDKRILDSMDNPPADTSTATNDGTSTEYSNTPATNPTPSIGDWAVPLDNTPTRGKFTVSLDYHVWASKGLHKGIDIPSPYGTAVYAAHDGTVTLIKDMGSCGYATVIQVAGTSGLYMGYQHMNPSVSMGQNVKKGQQVGVVGKFCGTGFHLHFSIETKNRVSSYADTGSNDTSLNPFKYIPDIRTPDGVS